MTTSFVRIVVVIGFLRNALSTQNVPPNQVVIALSLFLTFYIMAPYWGQANEQGLQPYLAGQITQEQAVENVAAPMREFMFKQTREADLALFVNLSDAERPESQEDVSTLTLIPAFIISELKTAFQIGFMIYIPFIVIDMIVASTLMSMGMMMLPPTMISLPFKILLFVIVGLAVSVFQATTSIQEQTLAFIPKIIAVFVAVLIFGPWMLSIMVEYVTNMLVNLPSYIG